MTSQEYKFPKERYNILVDSSSELIKILESLKFLLKNKNQGDERIATYSEHESQCVFLFESQRSNTKFLEITELDETGRRMLRYAFRDWKEAVLESILGTKLYDAIDKHKLLNIDNIKLFSVPGNWGEFEWKVCVGYHFNSYGDNFLPDNVGPYKPLVNTSQETRQVSSSTSSDEDVDSFGTATKNTPPTPLIDVSQEENAASVPDPKVQSTSGLKYWVDTNWRWVLAFCLGFLIASIISWVITNCCECDLSDRLEELLSTINKN